MNGPIEWIAAIGTIVAASLVAADWGRRWTGAGFVLFSIVAVLWVYSGLSAKDGMPIAVQNGILLIVNLYGVWQFLLSRRHKQAIDKVEELTHQAEHDVEAQPA